MRSFPLCGVRVLHPAQYDLFDITIMVTAKNENKNKKRCPGCLAHAAIGMLKGGDGGEGEGHLIFEGGIINESELLHARLERKRDDITCQVVFINLAGFDIWWGGGGGGGGVVGGRWMGAKYSPCMLSADAQYFKEYL